MQALTPASYSRNGDPAVVPWINAVGIDQAKRRHRAMAYCPECLQQGVALKRWRLSFHVWCPLHNRSLRDACGRCSAVFIPHLSRRSVAFCYSCSAVLSRASVNDDEFRYASVAGLQAQMGYWLEQACEGDVEARDRLHGLRILASLRTSALVGSAGRDPQGEHYCSAHLTGRLELLPLSERCRAMVWLSNLMAGWPASFHQLASDVGLSQRSFVRSGLEVMASSWLAGEVRCLPQGSARCRKKVALNASSRLARRSSNWRAVRAEILMKKVLSRGN